MHSCQRLSPTVRAVFNNAPNQVGLGTTLKVLEEGGVEANDDAVDASQTNVPKE